MSITRREFLRYAARLGLSSTAIALLDGCGIFPQLTPTPAKIPRIGVMLAAPREARTSFIDAFQLGMREFGYSEGKNIIVEWRFGENNDHYSQLAVELVSLKVDLIVAVGNARSRAAKPGVSMAPGVGGRSFHMPGEITESRTPRNDGHICLLRFFSTNHRRRRSQARTDGCG